MPHHGAYIIEANHDTPTNWARVALGGWKVVGIR